jgi:uncharacterized protein
MKKVLILHGWQGSDAPHWQSWLNDELLKLGYEVSFPQFSNSENPKKYVWMQEAIEAFYTIKPDIVITHSLANVLWFHLCNEDLISEVKHLLLVAPVRDLSTISQIKDFFPIKPPKNLYAQSKLLISSTDDKYMNESEAKKLAKKLGLESYDHKPLINAGHINSESGYGEWPWVLEWVKSRNV